MTQSRILIPLDGLPLAETALSVGRVVAQALEADIELVRVVPAENDPRADGAEYLARVASSMPAGVVTRVLHGDPGQCIVRAAGEDHVASVVMTTHARGGVRRAVLGSVADYVLAHNPAPTILTRAGMRAPLRLGTLLVAVDATGAAPLKTVAQLAERAGARVVLVHVVAPEELAIWQWHRGPVQDDPQVVVTARQELADVARRLSEKGIPAQANVLVGAAVPIISAYAERVQADLIVMASHARTGTRRTLQGSVTDGVLHTAQRPIMVCRLVPAPPGRPSAIDVVHALQHLAPPLVPQTIPESQYRNIGLPRT